MNATSSEPAPRASSFVCTAGLLLLAIGTMQLIGNRGHGLVQPDDPVFAISSRYLFWGVSGVELIVGLICLTARLSSLPITLIAWLTTNLLVYRVALFWFGTRDLKAYFVTMADTFRISPRMIDVLLTLAMGYLLCGSYVVLARAWWAKRRESSAGTTAAAARGPA